MQRWVILPPYPQLSLKKVRIFLKKQLLRNINKNKKGVCDCYSADYCMIAISLYDSLILKVLIIFNHKRLLVIVVEGTSSFSLPPTPRNKNLASNHEYRPYL